MLTCGQHETPSRYTARTEETKVINQRIWARERFPVVYEGDTPKAVLVDVESFDLMEVIVDNLFNRDTEPEDAILAASGILQRLVAQTQYELPSLDWEQELDEL